MWIGIVLVVTASGTIVTSGSAYLDKQECEAARSEWAARAEAARNVVAYRTECFLDDRELTVKKRQPRSEAPRLPDRQSLPQPGKPRVEAGL